MYTPQSYLNDKVLNCSSVADVGRVYDRAKQVLASLLAHKLHALVPGLHLFQADSVDLGRPLDIEVLLQFLQLLVEIIIHLEQAGLDDLFLLLLVESLSHNLDLKCLFMRFLTHHSLELECISLSAGAVHISLYYNENLIIH